MPLLDRRRRLRSISAAAGLCLALLAAGPAPAEDARLEALEKARIADEIRAEDLERQAQALGAELRALRDDLIRAARRIQDQESELSAIEDTLQVLTEEEQRKAAALRDRHEQLRRTLSALQRIALQPSEALIAAPGSPIDTVRSAMLLQVAVPAIEQRAAQLRRELDDLAELRGRITRERNELAALTESLADERQRIEALIERKRALLAATSAEQRAAQERAERLAGEAESLRELLASVEAPAPDRRAATPARSGAEPTAPAAQPRAAPPQVTSLTPPVGANRLYGFQPPGGPAPRVAPQRPTAPQSPPQPQALPQRLPDSLPEPLPEPPAEPVPLAGPTPLPEPGPEPGPAESGPDRGAPAATSLARLAEPDQIRPFPREQRSLLMPARGRLLTRYGERRAEGVSKGLVLATRPGAQVVATFDGQVAYAGPFRGYGNILIIDHGGQYHTLLAGLERIDAVTGQWVLAGEPIGIMAPRDGEAPELYIELRREGDPINPLPWLATTTDDKVRG